MLHLVSLWLGFAVSAGTATLPDGPPGAPAAGASTDGSARPGAPAPDPSSYAVTLENAKQCYFRGESSAAKELLQGLQLRLYAGEKVDWPLVADTLIYLGEIYYNEGNQDQAEVLFRYLLEQDPDTPISAFHHSVEVVNLFELVRNTILKSRLVPLPIPTSTPTPVWVFVPLGIGQYTQRRPVAGFVYGSLEAGFASASLALRFRFDRGNTLDFPNPLGWDKATVVERVQRERYLFQWPATFAFYLTWGISTVDAIRWHQHHPPAPRLGVTPDGTPTVGVTGAL